MSTQRETHADNRSGIVSERQFLRFRLGQRWEHTILFLSFAVLLLTGLPQKYRTAYWSQQILSSPENLFLVQNIHHISAVVLILEVIYHLSSIILLLSQRRLPAAMLVTGQDFSDAAKTLAYLLYLRNDRPASGRFNFEQKITYWFVFFGVGIMLISGIVLWFPELITRILPGTVVPAAKLAHSTEAIVSFIFIVIWHFYHVHVERANVSIFTGKINEEDMQRFHPLEYERLVKARSDTTRDATK